MGERNARGGQYGFVLILYNRHHFNRYLRKKSQIKNEVSKQLRFYTKTLKEKLTPKKIILCKDMANV